MDLLQSQFAKHDARNTGVVNQQQFAKALERFGIRGDGVQPVVQKFQTRGGQVNYGAFLKHFGGAQAQGGYKVSSYKEACETPRRQQQSRTHDLPSYMQGKHVDALIDRPADYRGTRSRTGRARENDQTSYTGTGTHTGSGSTAGTAAGGLGSPAPRELKHQEELRVTTHGTLSPTAPPRLLYTQDRRDLGAPHTHPHPHPHPEKPAASTHTLDASTPATPAAPAADLPSFLQHKGAPGTGADIGAGSASSAKNLPKHVSAPVPTAATPPSVGVGILPSAPETQSNFISKRAGPVNPRAPSLLGAGATVVKGPVEAGATVVKGPVEAVSPSVPRHHHEQDEPKVPGAAPLPVPTATPQGPAPAGASTATTTWRPSPNSALEVRTAHGVLDIYRSDSASLAAFANGEVMGAKTVHALPGLGSGCRRRGPNQDLSTVSAISCLNGDYQYESARDPGRRPPKPRRRARAGTPPPRTMDILTGREQVDADGVASIPRHSGRWDGEYPAEGRRYIVAPTASPTAKDTSGLRTYEGEERPFRWRQGARARSATPTGRRHLSQYPWYTTHFAAGVTGCPEDAPLLWPEGVPTNPTRHSSSRIPGFSGAVQATSPERVRGKAQTQQPSSFGYKPLERDHSPLPPRRSGGPLPPGQVKQQVASKVVLNHPTVTKAWMELTKDVRCESPGRNAKRVSIDRFASTLRNKYGVDVTAEDLSRANGGKGDIGLKDFNKMCTASNQHSVLIDKYYDLPQKTTGRRYLAHDRAGSRGRDSVPPFATGDAADTAAASTPRGQQAPDARLRARSAGPADRLDCHFGGGMGTPRHVKADKGHFETMYAQVYSPFRQRAAAHADTPGSPSTRGATAGLPSRARETTNASASIRCNSPDFRNRSTAMYNLLAHRPPGEP